MSYWKTKVVPKFKKFFDKGKNKAASETCKSFDSSKESIEKEIGEKTSDLHPKVIEIYRSSTVLTKKLLKEPNEPAVKENPGAAQSVLDELAKAGFPGAQMLSDAGVKFGPSLLPGPIVFLFQKTSTFLGEEPLPEPDPEPKHGTREIVIEGGEVAAKAEGVKESTEPVPDSTTTPPPIAAAASTTVETHAGDSAKAESNEEKKEVTPMEAKKEEIVAAPPIHEAKKEAVPAPATALEVKAQVPPVEAKKKEAEVRPAAAAAVEVEAQVPPVEAKKKEAEVRPPVAAAVVEKKEEVVPAHAAKQDKKEAAVSITEEDKNVKAKKIKEEPKDAVKAEEPKKEKPGSSDTTPSTAQDKK